MVYFDRVAAHLNFSLAAQELGVTTSAVSHRIKRLEVALGQQLFRRDHGAVVLTEAGYRLRNASKDAFDVLGRKIERTTGQRSLRVSMGPFLSVTWLMPLLSEYEKIHRKVRVELMHNIGKPDFANTDLTDRAVGCYQACIAALFGIHGARRAGGVCSRLSGMGTRLAAA